MFSMGCVVPPDVATGVSTAVRSNAPQAPGSSATVAGLVALLLWSMSVALMRGMSERSGLLTGPMLASLLGGALGLAWSTARGHPLGAQLRLPALYLWGCGALFVLTNVSLYLAIGLCLDHDQTLVIALVNYLWPALTVALSVPLLGYRARPWLPVGLLAAVAGTAVALLGGGLGDGTGATFWHTPRGLSALGLGGVAALSWGLYSNLARRWGDPEHGAVPLFALATGATLGLMLLAHPETVTWTLRGALEVATLGVASLAVAYALWDTGVRRGDPAVLGVASYFVPVASTLVSALYLVVVPGVHVISGAALVVAGAWLSKSALVAPATPTPPAGSWPG